MADPVKKTRNKAPLPPGPGRPKGSKNKVPAELREALRLALDGFAPRIPQLLEQVAAKDPAKALELVGRLGDFIVPRQARVHVGGLGGGITLADLVASIPPWEPHEIAAQVEAHRYRPAGAESAPPPALPAPTTTYRHVTPTPQPDPEPTRYVTPPAPAPAPAPAPPAPPLLAPSPSVFKNLGGEQPMNEIERAEYYRMRAKVDGREEARSTTEYDVFRND